MKCVKLLLGAIKFITSQTLNSFLLIRQDTGRSVQKKQDIFFLFFIFYHRALISFVDSLTYSKAGIKYPKIYEVNFRKKCTFEIDNQS